MNIFAMEYRPILLLLLQGPIAAWTLKCHICSNGDDVECYNSLTPQHRKFLRECHSTSVMCVTEMIILGEVPMLERKCASANWICNWDYKCFNCSTDGCNYHNKVMTYFTKNTPNLEATSIELIMANLHGLGTIVLVVTLLVIWGITKCCSKKEEDFYVDGSEVEEEDEEEVEYDDVDDYDDDDSDDYEDDDSIEEEYKDYEKEAEQANENIKSKNPKFKVNDF
ncbi:uncharacterized protein [Musca autumnalis]|uniref:uncharacterized protein n=1 Tax=Musca autumnalis TaxID=221902 RepID=UPI003CF0B057